MRHVRLEMEQASARPVTFDLEYVVEYDGARTTVRCQVYEALLPKLEKLIEEESVCH